MLNRPPDRSLPQSTVEALSGKHLKYANVRKAVEDAMYVGRAIHVGIADPLFCPRSASQLPEAIVKVVKDRSVAGAEVMFNMLSVAAECSTPSRI